MLKPICNELSPSLPLSLVNWTGGEYSSAYLCLIMGTGCIASPVLQWVTEINNAVDGGREVNISKYKGRACLLAACNLEVLFMAKQDLICFLANCILKVSCIINMQTGVLS